MPDLVHDDEQIENDQDLDDDEDDATDVKNHCGWLNYFFPMAAVASARAHSSAANIASRSGCATVPCRSITRATVSQICGKRTCRFKKAATATSLAAFMTAGRVPPLSPARRARLSAGKSS